jgi:hypothetical protein
MDLLGTVPDVAAPDNNNVQPVMLLAAAQESEREAIQRRQAELKLSGLNGSDAAGQRDLLFRPGVDDPSIRDVLNAAGHQGIAHRLAWFSNLREGSNEYQQFMDGATVLDWPGSADPLSTERASGKVLLNWVLGKHEPGSVMFESHLVSLQTWHAMSPDSNLTNAEVLDRIVGHAKEWFTAAQDSGSYVPLGKLAGHLIPDAFSRAHVARNESGEVLFFQSYQTQDSDAHSQADGPLYFAGQKDSYKTADQ